MISTNKNLIKEKFNEINNKIVLSFALSLLNEHLLEDHPHVELGMRYVPVEWNKIRKIAGRKKDQ